MTNFEYYKEEILEIINNGDSLGVCKGKPVKCTSIECSECISSDGQGCDKGIYPWLYAEHTEQPKLTKKERQFCELVETGWIVRGELGDLNFWIKKPEKRHQGAYGYWMASSNDDEKYNNGISNCLNIKFSFITWDDAEPWSVEDLLKLEVEE